MIIVISDTAFRQDESVILDRLFDEGLDVFHIRKYDGKKDELIRLLESIRPEFRSRVALHHDHDLAAQFGITRFHFREAQREVIPAADLEKRKAGGAVLSTSVHSAEAFERLPGVFDYVLAGPVFDSISKPGYSASESIRMVARSGSPVRKIAVGGIHAGNCREAVELGFDGIALLGSIWKSNDPVNEFKSIREKCITLVP